MIFSLGFALSIMAVQQGTTAETKRRPDVLFVISDDQSWTHAGAYGYAAARTPAGVEPPQAHPIAGRSMLELLRGQGGGVVEPQRDAVFLGRERHTSARHDNKGYPMRAIRTHDYLYIRNFAPERWPLGAPQALGRDDKLLPITHGSQADNTEIIELNEL